VTPLDIAAVLRLPTRSPDTHTFLRSALRFMEPATFEGLETTRELRSTQLPREDIMTAVRMGKFERVEPGCIPGRGLPWNFHGVNVFAVPELKGRRRLITEPHVNAALRKDELPRVSYPSRLGRRQSLKHCIYMLQIDFEAFYDTIAIPEIIRNNFVFRKGPEFFRLCTLPTGARWSVAVGQAITWTIVDIDTTVTIHTMIDNIMIAARPGEEEQFVSAVQTIVGRIAQANLLTSPPRHDLERMSAQELLELARQPNTFIGEEYQWHEGERRIRNSVKTKAKLGLALQAQSFTNRSFVSLVSLVLYALHTTGLNPAGSFRLLRAYRAVYNNVSSGGEWDAALERLSPKVYRQLQDIGWRLYQNEWWSISDPTMSTYNDADYDYIVFTDASAAGWGAIAKRSSDGTGFAYQQRWERGTVLCRRLPPRYPDDRIGLFMAGHSAHAEPRAAKLTLQQLRRDGMPDGSRVALVTDHFPIVHAQRRTNGFGGIGRGFSLNKLFEFTYDLWYTHNITTTFFHIKGPSNPADALSRVFGVEARGSTVVRQNADTTLLPSLRDTFSPVCDGLPFKARA